MFLLKMPILSGISLIIKRKRMILMIECWKSLGLQKIYSPSITSRRVSMLDFEATPDCIYEVGDAVGDGLVTPVVVLVKCYENPGY